MLSRIYQLPELGTTNFYLWGPRRTGKTTLLLEAYPEDKAVWFDLLDHSTYTEVSQNPSKLREQLVAAATPPGTQIVIDEIQRVPRLLPEIQLMIQRHHWKFALCGSSNRKLTRGGTHLLGGRATPLYLHGLVAKELGEDFKLEQMLNNGYFPESYYSSDPRSFMNGYIEEYLREELTEEGIARSVPVFRDFLEAAALRDGRAVTYAVIASECAVSAKTVQAYYQILLDSLIIHQIKPYKKSPSGRVPAASKFYFTDVALCNYLMKRGTLLEGRTSEFGKAFENWVFHELSTYVNYTYENTYDTRLSYWTKGQTEVDFIIGDRVAIEVKSASDITARHTKGLLKLAAVHPQFETLVIVCRERVARQLDNGILVLPYQEFVRRLWDGELIDKAYA